MDPVPSVNFEGSFLSKGTFPLAEPVAGTRPKFPITENSRTLTTYTVSRDQPFTLPCPAQAFPVPAFRYEEMFDVRVGRLRGGLRELVRPDVFCRCQSLCPARSQSSRTPT